MIKGKVEIKLVYNNLEFAGDPVIEKLDAELDGYRDSAALKRCITDSVVVSEDLYNPSDREIVLSGESGSVETSSSEVNSGSVSGDYREERLESPLLDDDDDDKYDFYKMLRRLMLTLRRKR